MSAPVGYSFPLKEFDNKLFRAKCEELIGLRPIGIRRHYASNEMTIYFERKLTDDQYRILRSLYETPPKGFMYTLTTPDEELVKNEVERAMGKRPVYLMLDDEGKIVEIAFEERLTVAEIDTLKTLCQMTRRAIKEEEI